MKRRMGMVLFWLFFIVGHGLAATPDPSSDCLSCHRQRDAALVTAWEKSRHNQTSLDCRSCHSGEHDGQMAARSRRNEACTVCHSRENSSHTLSKHGVIATLEAGRWDFSQPLREGNFRSPTCAYCHLHEGNHDSTKGGFPLAPLGRVPATGDDARSEARENPCRDCHSPRFVTTWFATGDRMVDIGRMKVREALAVMTEIENRDAELAKKARVVYHRMVEDHLRNVRIGVGHQSPDDQWWHGHPALDGDLLRIKSILSDLLQQTTGP